MTSPDARIVILGAGHAGGTAAALLRQYGHAGPITLAGEEPLPPYQRPPLSKAWLKGEADAGDLALKPLEFYAASRIDFRPGARAVALRRSSREVEFADGSVLPYDVLILAMGARPIRLRAPGADLEGVLALRSAMDAEALKSRIASGRKVVVVGGGYIGLEVAASARALGAEAAVVEREARLLARSGGETVAEFFRAYHQARGVEILLNAEVEAFEGEGGKLAALRLKDGRLIPCDVAVVGVGVAPNDELAAEAGLACARGVVVDLDARTSDPAIFAIGDVTHRPMPLYDRMFGAESVPNALEQARQAACAITGRPAPAPEVPWNWSDQYDLKLQIAGLPFDADSQVVRGDPSSGRFAVFHLKGDLIQQVEAVNSPAEFMGGRQLIGARREVDRAKLADPAVSMKEVAA